ncbi:putative concanavalin A-like lectin/glucanase domain-containing protein [Medicago truncatula]|uniref:Legume lectin beta domain protein n=1 Tax=Medicago truncatula TaxID=3880 RepID=A0A072ULJ7_MEDTR|nr:legume lectin beta domain protein [Medicago truncatula]RHN60600.1 putative concanavalin A-like lectin/glucanase domain-containing protein [Medicago truncatula]
MAFSSSYLPTQTLFSVLFLVFTMFFLLQATEGNSQLLDTNYYSFDVKNFSQATDNFTLYGSAQILPDGLLSLTNSANPNTDVGWVLYSTPIPIWNKNTGNIANFNTTFSFVVMDKEKYIDRPGKLVFFLVGENFQQEDPTYSHTGIDVNSRNWLKIVPLTRNSGSLISVGIRYESSTKTLTVLEDEFLSFRKFSGVVNLKHVLPNTVKVGIATAKHEIYIDSWSFHSHFTTSTTSMARCINIDIASYALLFFIYIMHEWLL